MLMKASYQTDQNKLLKLHMGGKRDNYRMYIAPFYLLFNEGIGQYIILQHFQYLRQLIKCVQIFVYKFANSGF